MSLPRVLLVDDSDAILAYGRAALSAHYEIATAKNGVEALAALRAQHQQQRFEIVLLDLSMPVMDGDEVLLQMKADAALADIPVVVVSSETQRAAACLQAGARAVLEKPVRADQLRATVARVLDEESERRERAGLAVLVVAAGQQLLALPLDCVAGVHAQVETRRVPERPAHLCEEIDLHGEPVAVVDLALGFAQVHAAPLLDRALVVIDVAGAKIALCVDRVRDPVLLPRERVSASAHDDLAGVILDDGGPIPVVKAAALLTPERLERLPAIVASATGRA